jgi:hypothetical protein
MPTTFPKRVGSYSTEESETTMSHNFSHWRFHIRPMEGIKKFYTPFLKEKMKILKVQSKWSLTKDLMILGRSVETVVVNIILVSWVHVCP